MNDRKPFPPRREIEPCEEQLVRFADNIGEPIIYFDRELRHRFVNRAFVEFSEIGLDQIQGRTVREIVPNEDYERQAALLARAFAGEQIEYERLAYFAGRPSRWMQLRSVPDREGEGPIRGAFLLLYDIQAQKESEAAIERINWVMPSPIDTLKIDKSFIRDITTDPDDKAIGAAIIALAHGLGPDVVAEGVETAGQLAFLTERGCNYTQGHFFSEPLESAEFVKVASRLRDGPASGLARAPSP